MAHIKGRIRQARTKAALSVNSDLVQLYWETGRAIVQKQRREGWGSAVIERLSRDLRMTFPSLSGFSKANIWRMRSFYLAYEQEDTILAQPVRESSAQGPPPQAAGIPWGHNILLVSRLADHARRLWYAEQTLKCGWSRSVLNHQIDSDLYHRHGQAITNFQHTLPPPDSDLAQQMLKDPYAFEFLDISSRTTERKLEARLIERLKYLLLELGNGFAFVGSQYQLEVGGDDFFVDLLFYHLNLRRFVLIDLKIGKFKPEYVGKMQFYITAVDRQMRHEQDESSIGLILCKERNRVVAEYALQDVTCPLGVATYRLLPQEVRRQLPSPEQLQEDLSTGH